MQKSISSDSPGSAPWEQPSSSGTKMCTYALLNCIQFRLCELQLCLITEDKQLGMNTELCVWFIAP